MVIYGNNENNATRKIMLGFDRVSGNVGIGSTSPGSFNGDLNTLVVGSGSGNQGMTIFAGTASTSNISFHDTANTSLSGMIRYDHSNDAMSFWTNGVNERARIDSSGRLLVGTSTARTTFSISGIGYAPQTQLEGGVLQASFVRGNSPYIGIAASDTATSSTVTGNISFFGNDGTNFIRTAEISSVVDGTPGANDMPGRLVFSVTADGASSPTEALRITNDRVVAYNQAAPAAVNTTATITAANLKTGIITSTTAAAVTMTLPTGTDIEAGFSGIYTNMTFEFSVINTGPNTLTVGANGNTTVGSLTVATLTSARYALRRTGANAFTLYRLS
jgi:hypothetical protein